MAIILKVLWKIRIYDLPSYSTPLIGFNQYFASPNILNAYSLSRLLIKKSCRLNSSLLKTNYSHENWITHSQPTGHTVFPKNKSNFLIRVLKRPIREREAHMGTQAHSPDTPKIDASNAMSAVWI